MKQVLYITYDGLLDPLGSSQILPYLYGLSSNYEISILSYEKKEKLDSKEHSELNKDLTEKNINHYYLKFLPKFFLPLQLIKGFFKCINIIKKNKIKFTHARGFPPCMISFLLKKTLNIPYIFDTRGFWVEERMELGVLKKGLLYDLLKKIENSMMRNAAQIVVLTHAMKNELCDNYKIKTPITVIPTCTDLKKFFANKKYFKKLKLIYFGSYGERYDLGGVIKFFEVLSMRMPAELTLVLNNVENLSENLLQKLKENKKIKLLEKQPRNKMPSILQKHNISIYFLNVPLSRKGVCPTRFGESLASGLPVITNAGIGDCDETITKNKAGIILKEKTKEGMLNSIKELKKLLGDEHLSKRCRNFAEKNLSLKKGVTSFARIYELIQ